MSNAPRATMTKRQREVDQKDRVRQREERRADRRARSAARAASGQVGPPMGEAMAPLGDYSPDMARTDLTPPRDRTQPKGNTRLYVGNLSYDATSESLRELFSECVEVEDVHLVVDRDTGRPRGFAFVSMATPAAAATAIREMDGRVVDNRPLRVNEAEERSGGSGGNRRR